MNYAIFMNILHTRYNLLHEFYSFLLIQSFPFNYIIKKLSPFCVLHDQMDISFGFYNLVKLNNIGMSQYFEDAYLSGDPFYIRLLYDFLFL